MLYMYDCVIRMDKERRDKEKGRGVINIVGLGTFSQISK